MSDEHKKPGGEPSHDASTPDKQSDAEHPADEKARDTTPEGHDAEQADDDAETRPTESDQNGQAQGAGDEEPKDEAHAEDDDTKETLDGEQDNAEATDEQVESSERDEAEGDDERDEEDEEEPEGAQEEAPEEGAEPEAPPPPPPPPPPLHDGLDSGLAWFGDEPFVPPTPTGYLLSEAGERAAPAAAAAVAPAPAVAERPLGVRERFEARRKEAEAARTWYQKIPIPVFFTLPAFLFIVIWILFVAQPWSGVADPREKLDEALLTAPAAAEQAAGIAAMGVAAAEPLGHWQLLTGKVLRMGRALRSAKLVVPVPPGLEDLEATCDLCIAQGNDYGGYQVTFMLDDRRGVALLGNQYPKVLRGGVERQRTDYVAARKMRGAAIIEARHERALKLNHWYKLRILVEGGTAHFYVNGTRVAKESPCPEGPVANVVLAVSNARVLVRNLKVKAAK